MSYLSHSVSSRCYVCLVAYFFHCQCWWCLLQFLWWFLKIFKFPWFVVWIYAATSASVNCCIIKAEKMGILSGRFPGVLVVIEPRLAIVCHLYCPAVWQIGVISTDFWAARAVYRESVSLLHMACWMWREWFVWRPWKHGHLLRNQLNIIARKPSSLALAPVD